MWFIDRLDPGSAAYNVAEQVRWRGPICVPVLQKALAEIVSRHETLRTTLHESAEQLAQIIAPHVELELAVVDASAADDPEAEAARRVVEEARAPFDLAAGPLFRATLVRVGPDDHVLVLVLHHIVSDGWSIRILREELLALYDAFSRHEPSPLKDLPVQYADYAVWQREKWRERQQVLLAYWTSVLTGAPLLELPTDRPRPPTPSHRGATHRFVIPEPEVEALETLARREGATLFMTLLATFATLLSRYSGQTDIVIGTPAANRVRAEVEPLIGCFVNTLALRLDLAGSPPVSELLRRVRGVTLAAYEHQEAPFEQVIERLQLARDQSRAALFQVMFVFGNNPRVDIAPPGVQLEWSATDRRSSMFDLTLSLGRAGGRLEARLDYDSDLFDQATAERLAAGYCALLEATVAGPEGPALELPVMPEAERQRVLIEWNATSRGLPAMGCLREVFEHAALQYRERVALASTSDALTYEALNERANQLGRHLRRLGVRRGVIVAICLERGIDLVVAVLGVIKAGGAYLPLDPEYPHARIDFMVDDAKPSLVITHERILLRLSRSVPALYLDSQAMEIAREDRTNLDVELSPSDLANVIYTSGSSGRPKGVMVEHGGLCNLAMSQAVAFRVTPESRVLQFASASFDACTSEIFATFASGAALFVAAKEEIMPGPPLQQLLQHAKISHVTLPPSALDLLDPERLPELRTLVSAGERCSKELVARWSSGRVVLNAYGPTETSVCATISEPLDGDTEPPIGRPIDNARTYVLDEAARAVPIGVPGELYIGGAGVSRGYLGQPELTSTRFVPDPFSDVPGARLYRSGDQCRWREDGTLEFLGRLDHQVKVRGFRIELGEIESVLLASAGVRAAVVLAREDVPGDKRLVAYVVAADGATIEADALRTELGRALPDHMVPNAFVVLENLPLNANGKVDRRALPVPDFTASAGEYVAPRTPMEEAVAQIWADVMHLERVGVHDDFFALGGHSLLAIQVVSRIRSRLKIDVPLRALFESATVARLTLCIASIVVARPIEPIAAVDRDAPPDLSRDLSYSNEYALAWIRVRPLASFFQAHSVVRRTGPLDRTLLERAFREVFRRHDVLRRTFDASTQTMGSLDHESLPIESDDSSGARDGEERGRELVEESLSGPIVLDGGPLTRVRIIRHGAEDHTMTIVCHPLANDPVGIQLFVAELGALYEALATGTALPPEPTVQYRDFARWQREWFAGAGSERVAAARAHYAKATPVALTCRRERLGPPRLESVETDFTLDADTFARLRAFCMTQAVTPYVLFLAAIGLVAECGSGQHAATIATLVNTQRNQHRDLATMLGFFFNQVFCHTSSASSETFGELVERARRAADEGLAFGDVPAALVLEDAAVMDSPLFRIAINGPNLSAPGGPAPVAAAPPVTKSAAPGVRGARNELMFSGWQVGDRLACAVSGAADVYGADSVRAIADAFQLVLTVLDPDRSLRELRRELDGALAVPT